MRSRIIDNHSSDPSHSDANTSSESERRRSVYTEMIRQQEAVLLRAAWRLCNGQQDRAQDLVQETLVRGYEAFLEGRFEEGSNARAWLMRILTNFFLNDYRRDKKWVAHVDLETIACDAPPDAALMETVLEEPLEKALYSLSEEMRVCVVLVDIEGFEYAETASILNIPVGTVRSRLSRARQQLYTLLYEYAQEHRRV